MSASVHTVTELATSLHVTTFALMAATGGAALFVVGERRGRDAWARASARLLGTGPYRSNALPADARPATTSRAAESAPPLVRVAAILAFVVALLFAPWLVFALVKFRFDGVANGILPGVTMALVNARCAWLLLTRPPASTREAIDTAVALLIAHGILLVIGAAHLALGTDDPDFTYDGRTSPLVYLGVTFALASIVQAVLMLVAIKAHRRDLEPLVVKSTHGSLEKRRSIRLAA